MSSKMESYVITAPATSRQLPIDPDSQDDPFYRYKTHQLVIDFKGKRGLLVNLDLVAKNLQTSADYIATYLATSLNAAVKRATVKQSGSTTAVSYSLYPATFTLDKINLCFHAFLTSFVMCPACARPELINVVSEPKPASPQDHEAASPSSSPPSSSPPKDAMTAPKKKASSKKAAARAASQGSGPRVTVRCQACGWSDSLRKSLQRVKNVKFVDYVLAHPPQQTSPTLLE